MYKYFEEENMEKLSNKFVQLLLYVAGYLGLLTALLASGFILYKGKDENNKKVAKTALVLAIIFVIIEAFITFYLSFFVTICGLSGAGYSIYIYLSAIVSIAKIAVFTVFACISLFSKNNKVVECSGTQNNNQDQNNAQPAPVVEAQNTDTSEERNSDLS